MIEAVGFKISLLFIYSDAEFCCLPIGWGRHSRDSRYLIDRGRNLGPGR